MTDREVARDRAAAQTDDADSVEDGENPVMSGVRDEDELRSGARVGDEARIGDPEAERDPVVEGAPIGPGAGVVGASGAFVDPTTPVPGSAADEEPDEGELRHRSD